ncbi:RNA polymerase sigma factor [Parabacteroides pacaensis]|uniref:RNA polymerase sigma factor n=1 Tax=Parabacteroides pacaensis TaxID=2086575 RepID=UPI000D103AE5|nr:sigma-70 family RNA polymerase sigma factor [Parabacteroides pacaensis]
MTNEEAWYTQIYTTYVNDLFSYGRAFGFNDEELMDAIHDVFLHIMDTSISKSKKEHLKFYLLCSLKNRLISMKRRPIIYESIEEINEYTFSLQVTELDLLEEKEEKEHIKKLIEEMLQTLTDRQREAIYLRFMQELEYEQVAELLGMTPKGVRKLIYRAINHIRDTYGPTTLFFFLYLHFF